MYKFRILIVDDNSQFIDSLNTILNFYFEDKIESITSANNAEQCLDVLKEKKIDIIFMDYDMPNVNGATLTEMINADYRYIKVIAVSFHKEKRILKQMIHSGARDYITKEEINKENLEKCLNHHLI